MRRGYMRISKKYRKHLRELDYTKIDDGISMFSTPASDAKAREAMNKAWDDYYKRQEENEKGIS